MSVPGNNGDEVTSVGPDLAGTVLSPTLVYEGESQAVSPEPMPPGIHNAYIFGVFDTTAWSVVLGAPMLLFLQHLKASATIVAVAFCLAPILNILQIPAARFVERLGYRRFVLRGWTIRNFLILGMAFVTVLPESVDRTTRLLLILFLLLFYNILRCVSLCGMLPWFTHIVPEGRRGEFLAKNQSAIAFSSIFSLLFFGLILTGDHARYCYGVVYFISFITAVISLRYLRRIPDVPVEKMISNSARLPWKEMFFYPPFFRYIVYNIIINVALGSGGAFGVRLLAAGLHVNGADVLFISCITNVVLVATLFVITPMIDRAGNKHVLTLSGILLTLHFLGWGCMAAGLDSFNWKTIAFQTITLGFGGALWNIANVRMVMDIIPVTGRPHFLAIYSVAVNLTIGIVPLLWGPVLDYLERWHVPWTHWNWNCYSLLYVTLAFTIAIGVGVLQTLHEPKKMTWNVFMREFFVKTPGHAFSRVIGHLHRTSVVCLGMLQTLDEPKK